MCSVIFDTCIAGMLLGCPARISLWHLLGAIGAIRSIIHLEAAPSATTWKTAAPWREVSGVLVGCFVRYDVTNSVAACWHYPKGM